MSRQIGGAIVLLAFTVLAACTDATGPRPIVPNARLASGSTSAGGSVGGGSGGGGGGGAAKPCAILTLNIINNVLLGTSVPSFWQPNMGYVAQVSGTAEKSCDVIPNATIKFEDLTGANDGCDVVLTPWVNNPNYLNPKYGAKPMSRYLEAFIYYTGANCLGHSRTLKATLTDPSVGGLTSTATLNWTP